MTETQLQGLHRPAPGPAAAIAQRAASPPRATGGGQHAQPPERPLLPARSSTLRRWSRFVRRSAAQRWSSSTAARPSTFPHPKLHPPRKNPQPHALSAVPCEC